MTVTEAPSPGYTQPAEPAPQATPPPEPNAIPESTQPYQGPPRAWLTQNALWRPQMSREEVRSTLAALWKPTPPELIAKLAKYTGDTKVAPRDRPKRDCAECGSYHAFPCVHLDYLGHSDTTRLVAEADACWGWYPQAGFDEHGEPRMVRNQDGYPIRMWIWLDILGVVRPGVGTVDTGKTDPEKELIGDAIRNAAQRFGIAADLWSKAKGHEAEMDSSEGHYQRRAENQPPADGAPPSDKAPAPSLDEWAQKAGWLNGEADLTEASARVKAEIGKLIEAGKINRDQGNKAWQDYNHPDPQRPTKVLPRTAESHAAWWTEVISPLADPVAQAAPAEEPAPSGRRRQDKADIPNNGYYDELDLLYRTTVDEGQDGGQALADDLQGTSSGEISRALAFRGADGQGAGDTLRRRLGLIIVRRAEADKAAGKWKLDESAIFAGSHAPPAPADTATAYAEENEEPF